MYNIPEAEIDQCKFRMRRFPAKVGAKKAPGPTQHPPQDARFLANGNGLAIKKTYVAFG
jgi:hypothetical protein